MMIFTQEIIYVEKIGLLGIGFSQIISKLNVRYIIIQLSNLVLVFFCVFFFWLHLHCCCLLSSLSIIFALLLVVTFIIFHHLYHSTSTLLLVITMLFIAFFCCHHCLCWSLSPLMFIFIVVHCHPWSLPLPYCLFLPLQFVTILTFHHWVIAH